MRIPLLGLILALSVSGLSDPQSPPATTDIRVDQVGYLPGAPKAAMVVAKAAAGSFVVRRVGDGKVEFRGTLSAPAVDASSGDNVQTADFTSMTQEGKFYIEVPGLGLSWPFAIAPDVYSRAFYLAMRSFYGQRCGMAVDLGPEFPGYTHDVCHTENAYHATSGKTGVKATGNKGWHDAGDYGRYVVNSGLSTGTLLWTYVLGGGTGEAAEAIRKASIAAADDVVTRTAADGYRTSLGRNDYVWGSNGVAANYGLQLLVADVLAPNPRYRDAAADNLHYLLGRNTFSLSWVTRVGANPVRHPHHRPSGADQNPEPWPGLLSGGPNGRKQDPAMNMLPDLPPARMFIDHQASYASNEVAINWNAPLVFLLAGQLPKGK